MQDSKSGGIDSQDEINNMKLRFNEKLSEYCYTSDDLGKQSWTTAAVARKYDTMELGEKRVVIQKRRVMRIRF